MPEIALIPVDMQPSLTLSTAGKSDPESESAFGSMLSKEISSRDSSKTSLSPQTFTEEILASNIIGTEQQKTTADVGMGWKNALEAILDSNDQNLDSINPLLFLSDPFITESLIQPILLAQPPVPQYADITTIPPERNFSLPAVSLDQTEELPSTEKSPKEKLTDLFATLIDFNAKKSTPVTDNEPIISAQLQQLITSKETRGISIIQIASGTATLKDLDTLTPSVSMAGQVLPNPEEVTTTKTIVPAATSVTPEQLVQNPITVSAQAMAGFSHEDIATQNITPPKLTSLRQDIQGQYIEAQLQSKNKPEAGEHHPSMQQEASGNPQSSLSTPVSQTPTNSDLSNTFAQVSQVLQDTTQTAAAATTSAKHILLPSGTLVPEESVLQQVINKFQITSHLQDTRLSIKLHPEELGALKIDLTLREGVIRANVVAQTPQVQEIIEKNMPRLKVILENQGFMVDTIHVTTEADSVGSFDFFQGQFSSEAGSNFFSSQKIDTQGFSQVLDPLSYDEANQISGVNIQA